MGRSVAQQLLDTMLLTGVASVNELEPFAHLRRRHPDVSSADRLLDDVIDLMEVGDGMCNKLLGLTLFDMFQLDLPTIQRIDGAMHRILQRRERELNNVGKQPGPNLPKPRVS